MRRSLDQYWTPEWATDSLLNRIIKPTGTIFECCAGEGAISTALERTTLSLVTNDIDSQFGTDYIRDASQASLFREVNPAWTISNPPFSVALPIVQNAVQYSTEAVAMLLRLSFLEPTYDRSPWLDANPPDALLVTPRISFTNDGKSDSVTTAWFIWYCNPILKGNLEILRGIHIIPKQPRELKKQGRLAD